MPARPSSARSAQPLGRSGVAAPSMRSAALALAVARASDRSAHVRTASRRASCSGVMAIDMRAKVEHVLVPASKAETRHTRSVSAPGPGSNPYHVRLSELEKYRPMPAPGRSPLDPADEDDLLPTSTGQV